jgi:hypothetical protein
MKTVTPSSKLVRVNMNILTLKIDCVKKIFFSCCLFLLFALTCRSQTSFGKNTGEYGEFFTSLTRMLTGEHPEGQPVELNGKKYNLLVIWIRDHVHALKAMKWFMRDVKSGTQLFLEQQTPDGFFYDYIYPISHGIISRLNFFHRRYTKLFTKDQHQMHRLPVEADVEYLVVEGVYYAWQATGDTAFVRKWMPALEKAMTYVKSDTVRWSREHQLVKRGYTIDTWDFQYMPLTRDQFRARYGDVSQGIMDVKDTTFMGIMHGDNSGMYAACRQMAAMYKGLGNTGMGNIWNKEAELFQVRANTLLWNGKYYKHFLPIGPLPPYMKFDIVNQLSLSNPYDVNRGMPDESMSQSIIQTYLDLKEKNKAQSFAEWYSLYPDVKPDWAGIEAGTYVNGGILIVTAGELAKAAFQHGYEEYGADIIKRLHALSKKTHDTLYACYRPDGTTDGGLPDSWAQAAVVSAMVEGLAGVIDRTKLFDEVEISPRWMAAAQDEASITVGYGASGKKVSYDYKHNASAKSITLKASGDPSIYNFRILLPKGVSKARATVNGKTVSLRYEKLRSSVYAVAENIKENQPNLVVKY